MLKTLSQEEQERMLEVALKKSYRDHAIIKTFLYTGIRVSELSGLIIDDVMIASEIKHTLVVRKEIAKRANQREIPFSVTLQKTLSEYLAWLARKITNLDQSYPLFQQYDRIKPLSSRQVQRIALAVGKEALGRRVHPHLLRHTFATGLLKVTNIRVVQDLLGHKNISTTQVYTHPTMNDAKQAVEGLNNRHQPDSIPLFPNSRNNH